MSAAALSSNLDHLSPLVQRVGKGFLGEQATCDRVPTIWLDRASVHTALEWCRDEESPFYNMLYDLTGIDERVREHRQGQPESDFTLVYHLLSFDRNEDLRIKVPLKENDVQVDSIVNLWPVADWYEREAWDMFGIRFNGHPHLRRLLLPITWQGHPLRKEHPARATEMDQFHLTPEKQEQEQDALRFDPAEWGMEQEQDGNEFLFLNLGPQHPGTHGVLRIVLQLEGERIVDAVPDIGFHHRGAEKMAERQTWHTYIPYTDRVDYLGGVMNNFPYVLAVEQLGGIRVPWRAQVIRVMMAELFRIASHLVWYGTFAQDVGALSPVFYMFTDRERIFDIVEAICGGRMHPSWFRIGGVAQDLPSGWDRLIRDFLNYMPSRLDEYDGMVMRNRIFKGRTKGVGAYTKKQAMEWGVTGPGLRACGWEWDFRKKRPYGGYDQFEFDVPTAERGDCYDRAIVRVEEMRQSLRIIDQCVKEMPPGHYQSDHPLATPPRKERTMEDIETLINHFLNVSWGPVLPAGESFSGIEATKGSNGYYLISDHDNHAYRARIRSPSFPHIQMVRPLSKGMMVPDLLALLGSIDFVLADVDR